VAPHEPYTDCKKCGKRCASKSHLCEDCRLTSDKERFLKSYASYAVVGNAAAACKVSCSAVYRWLEKDEEFLNRYQTIQRLLRDDLAGLLYRAAKGDGEQTVERFFKNGETGTRSVPREMKPGQLNAILNILRATEHLAHRNDFLVFDEKRRADFLDPPRKQIQWIEVRDAPPRTD
jgi:hypothetical protein